MPRTRKTTTGSAPSRARARGPGPAAVAPLTRDLMELLMFGTGRTRRFTQDSPVLPDVWLGYAKRQADTDPYPPLKLLLTPFRDTTAGEVRTLLRDRLAVERRSAGWRAFGHPPEVTPRIVYNQSTVAATLYFEDLIRVVLPLTDWWSRNNALWRLEELQDPAAQRVLAQALKDPEHARVERGRGGGRHRLPSDCLLYTSDAADEL